MEPTVYTGRLYYEPSRIHAAACYCSDGRLGEHFDDFLLHGLRLPRYDRVALPGGPAALLPGCASTGAASAWPALDFLVDAHGLERVLLIAHEGCAFYARHFGRGNRNTEEIQRRDLLRAATRILAFTPQLQVETYFARIDGHRIAFEAVQTPSTDVELAASASK